MNVLVTGATGFIGRPLCKALAAAGYRLTAVARDPVRASRLLPVDTHVVQWKPGASDGSPQLLEAVRDSEVIINLAGESIGGRRWTPAYKEQFRRSRIDTTRALATAMQTAEKPGRVFLSGSAVGYYGDRGNATVTEQSLPGGDFLARLCVDWEAEALAAEKSGARVVLLRTGIVLGEGGSLEQMARPFHFGLGGPLGSGRQWISWIHIADEIGMILWALGNHSISGPINLTAPHPVTNREMARALGKALHKPSFMPAPAFALKLILGEFAHAVLTGQKVLPTVAQKMGYQWKYPTLEPALQSILAK